MIGNNLYSGDGKLVLMSFAHPVEHVPPPINSAKVLSDHGYRVILLGYQKPGKPMFERIGHGAIILRAPLRASRIKFGFLRKLFVVVEFIGLTVKLNKRLQPHAFIAFNEVAAIANRFIKNRIRNINWLLEFPENETGSAAEGLLKRLSVKSWHRASVNIFPTKERMAMASVRAPRITRAKLVVIHNCPTIEDVLNTRQLSAKSQQAIKFLKSSDGSLKIVYTGAVGNRYGWNSLIKAVGETPNTRLLILGSKHDLGEREYAQAISGCRFPENILWLDAIPYSELQQIIIYADLGFVTYRGDTLNTTFAAPGKLYEYLKAGLVVMTDSNSCIFDYLKSYNCGYFFEKPFTDVDISNIIKTVEFSSIRKMKDSSLILFKEHFNMERQMESLLKLLAEI